MDAEQQAPQGGDTPDNAPTPEVEASQPETVNWEERYKHLQSDHTRAAQEAAELKRIVDGARQGDPQAIEALGLALAEQDETTDSDDAPQYLTRDEWQQYHAQQEAERQQAERVSEIETAVEKQLDDLKVADDSLRDWLVSRAIALPPTADGMPDVQAAYQQFESLMNAQKKQWATSKRTHHVSPVGQEGTQVPDTSTHEGRVAIAMSRLGMEG
jgi:hypothetical protein